MNIKWYRRTRKGRGILTLIPITVVVLCLALLPAAAILLPAVIPISEARAEGAPPIDWIRQFGTDYWDTAYVICADATGIYVAGETESALPGQSSAGGVDAFVRKYDRSGNELWTSQFGSDLDDVATGIYTAPTGIYLAGQTYGALPGQSTSGEEDAFVRKYDASGNELWTRQFGTYQDDVAWTICADATGIYVAGTTDGALPGQTNSGGVDAFVRKYDASGNELWTIQFGSDQDDCLQAVGICADTTGIYVAGDTQGALPGQSNSGKWDAFVRKYDADANELWTRQFGTDKNDHLPYGICTDATDIYVTGYTYGTFPGQSNSGESDAFVRKYDGSGNELWTRQFGTDGYDWGVGICADATGIYVAGQAGTETTADFDDAFVRKYDASGNELWTSQFGSDQGDEAIGICADATGIYASGRTDGALPGQSSSGERDAFIAKFLMANTPTGNDVSVVAQDPQTGEDTPVTVTFEEVTQAGDTTADVSDTGLAPPHGFELATHPPTYFDIQTTAHYTPPVTVCIDYSGMDVKNESKLTLMHWTGTQWEDVTISLDILNDIICGSVTSLSDFALMIPQWVVESLLPSTENNKAGRTMPVKFSIRVDASADPSQPFVYDEGLTIKIFATSDPANILQTSTFGSGAQSYRIADGGKQYHTNFKTLKAPMQYTVEIYKDTFLVGSFTFKTVK